VGLVLSSFLARAYTQWLGVDSLLQLVLGMTLVSISFMVFGFFGILSREQRGKVRSYASQANPFQKRVD